MTHLKVGEPLPSFSLPNQNGELLNIDTIRCGKNLVLYFYPKDDTIVCTQEACDFRDNHDKFKHLNGVIVGISSDPPQSHSKFIKSYKLPFTLLSDVDNTVRKRLGVPRDLLGLLPGRYTYVINTEGIIIHISNSHFYASKHINESLNALENEQATNK